MKRIKTSQLIVCVLALSALTACVAKDITLTEQQKRMQRCDQYIDRERDACLRGDTITIEDYKTDFRAYQRSVEKDAKQKQAVIDSFLQSSEAAAKPAKKEKEQSDKLPQESDLDKKKDDSSSGQ